MLFRRTYGSNDTFTYSRKYGSFTGTADQSVDIGPDSYSCLNKQLDTVLSDSRDLGVSITLGVTLILTASNTFLPARSIAEAFSNDSSMPALSAAINAFITLSTFPPAR